MRVLLKYWLPKNAKNVNSGQFFKDLFSEYPLFIEEKVKITYKWADLKEFDFKYCHNLFITHSISCH